MTAASQAATAGAPDGRWRRRLRQVGALAVLEIRGGLASRRSLPLYLFALAPVALVAIALAASHLSNRAMSVAEAETAYAIAYREFALRWCVFFGVATVFMNLFRGEILDRTLHYYFLTPVRRELLVVGKYAAGLVATGLVLGLSTVLAYFLMLARVPELQASEHVLHGPAVSNALAYAGITVLACAGYGALFLAIGLFVRTPIVPTLVILGWEYAHFLMPPALKLLSVSYYLDSLLPMPVSEAPVAIIAEPASPGLAITEVIVFALALLCVAAARVRRMEIRYGAD